MLSIQLAITAAAPLAFMAFPSAKLAAMMKMVLTRTDFKHSCHESTPIKMLEAASKMVVDGRELEIIFFDEDASRMMIATKNKTTNKVFKDATLRLKDLSNRGARYKKAGSSRYCRMKEEEASTRRMVSGSRTASWRSRR